MNGQTIGRCHTCKAGWTWRTGRFRRLVTMRCPRCAGPLSATTHLYQGRFRPVPLEVADLICAGIYDDWGKVR